MACTLFGMAFSQLRERGTAVLELFTGIYDGTIVIVRWLMWYDISRPIWTFNPKVIKAAI